MWQAPGSVWTTSGREWPDWRQKEGEEVREEGLVPVIYCEGEKSLIPRGEVDCLRFKEARGFKSPFT